ncbi:MAG: argininosuccinate synthase [Bacteroidales bacterium]|jgi:argininosuccinate synthase|nr:argininosuccinate synthase [Bacteroidales bacterium]MCI1733541.1 argininosuccinate synthase [Bacteroidales bacterium]
MSKKVVLAFSGGLDTSFCVPYLKEQGYEVHTVMVNTGGFDSKEVAKIEKRAKDLGAASHTTVDAVDTYYKKGIKYLIFGNVLKNDTYPLSVSSERIFQALEVLKLVKKLKAEYVAHGSTGAGNDQVRFDVVFNVLAPNVKIIAPIREHSFQRKYEIDYLVKHGFDFSWSKSKYSINQGIWGSSIGGVETLSSDGYLPEEAYLHHVTKQGTEKLSIEFLKGEIVGVNGKKMNPVSAIREVAKRANAYGIGRDIHIGDTIIGIKGRVGFEAAAPLVIIKAHHLLEKHVLVKGQLNWKDHISIYYGQLMHEAQYLDPTARDMEAFLESAQRNVTGTVEVLLRPYCFFVLGCKSKYDLMNSHFGAYGELNKSYTGQDVIGFTKVMSNPLKIYYSLHNEK